MGENCVNVTEGGREGGRKEGTKKKGGGGCPHPPTLVMLHLGRVMGMEVWVRTVLMGQREKREGEEQFQCKKVYTVQDFV